jgi:hypothetical protein
MNRINRWISNLIQPYQVTTTTYESVSEVLHKLSETVNQLENRISILEEENIENTNLIYELINSSEAIDRRIDIVAEHLSNKNNV